MAQRHELVVYLGTDTMRPQEGMDAEGKVQRRASSRHRLDLTLRCEDENLRSEEVEFDSVEEIHGIGLWVVKNLLDGAQPFVQFRLVLRKLFLHAVLVFPMGGKPLFGNLIHTVRTDLHLYPSSLFRHQGDMQCLVAVSLWMTQPVTQAVGMRLVNLRDGNIDVEALVDLLLPFVGCEDDADGKDVIDLFEGDMLVLHLVPDGVRCLYTFLDLILDTHLSE